MTFMTSLNNVTLHRSRFFFPVCTAGDGDQAGGSDGSSDKKDFDVEAVPMPIITPGIPVMGVEQAPWTKQQGCELPQYSSVTPAQSAATLPAAANPAVAAMPLPPAPSPLAAGTAALSWSSASHPSAQTQSPAPAPAAVVPEPASDIYAAARAPLV
jgi:hypothetical protein